MNSGLLPIHETKKFKSFPELVNVLNNPFTKSGLNIGLKGQLAIPGAKELKSRSNYYKSCRGCQTNIDRLVITRNIERASTDSIVPRVSTIEDN